MSHEVRHSDRRSEISTGRLPPANGKWSPYMGMVWGGWWEDGSRDCGSHISCAPVESSGDRFIAVSPTEHSIVLVIIIAVRSCRAYVGGSVCPDFGCGTRPIEIFTSISQCVTITFLIGPVWMDRFDLIVCVLMWESNGLFFFLSMRILSLNLVWMKRFFLTLLKNGFCFLCLGFEWAKCRLDWNFGLECQSRLII